MFTSARVCHCYPRVPASCSISDSDRLLHVPYPGTHNIRHHPITNSLLFASRGLAGSRACRSTSVVVVDILRPLVYL